MAFELREEEETRHFYLLEPQIQGFVCHIFGKLRFRQAEGGSNIGLVIEERHLPLIQVLEPPHRRHVFRLAPLLPRPLSRRPVRRHSPGIRRAQQAQQAYLLVNRPHPEAH